MPCPMFINCTRECIKKIKYTPSDTLQWCVSEKFEECPFYRQINGIGILCENIESCPTYEYFAIGDFEEFLKMTKEYCLSENNTACRRYQLKKAGQKPPAEMLPDGKMRKK
jgi:hypothetical protein